MHPIERLRYVARSSGAASSALVAETAAALRAFGGNPQGMVTACRRIVARQPTAGPLWYLAARALTAPDGVAEAQRVAAEVADDTTPRRLGHALPQGATIVVVGWPDHTATALGRRGDLRVRVVDSGGEGGALVDALVRVGSGRLRRARPGRRLRRGRRRPGRGGDDGGRAGGSVGGPRRHGRGGGRPSRRHSGLAGGRGRPMGAATGSSPPWSIASSPINAGSTMPS